MTVMMGMSALRKPWRHRMRREPQSLGAGGNDELAAHDLEQRRPGVARHLGGDGHAQQQHRHDHVAREVDHVEVLAQRGHAARGQELEVGAQEVDEHQAHDEPGIAMNAVEKPVAT